MRTIPLEALVAVGAISNGHWRIRGPIMSSETAHNHDHDYTHSSKPERGDSTCCSGTTACADIKPSASGPANGRSFQVSGLDCAEEVSILNKVVGPAVGGA